MPRDREKQRAAQRRYARKPENKKKIKEYRNRPEIKKKIKEYKKEYDQRPENKKKRKEYHKEYQNRPEYKKKRYLLRKNNPAHKKRKHLREKVRLAVIYQKSYISTIHKLIGCDVMSARAHLEAQFEPWMTWENYGRGKGKWNIDHIIRVGSIDIFDEDEVKRIFHYSNMRPLCFIKNCENTDEGRNISHT